MTATDAPLTLEAAWQVLLRVASCHDASTATTWPLRLSTTGWQCSTAVSDDAQALLDCLVPLTVRAGRLAIAQLGQSLDGRIATQSGHSHYVNGLESRVHLHRLRALMDAVVVGAGTACEDDPQLTVRHVAGPQPVRVILDPRGRVPASLRLLQDPAAPTLLLHGAGIALREPVGAHVSRRVLPLVAGGFDPAAVLDTLAERGLERVLIEGGGITVSRFLEADVLDRLHLLVAPLLIGSGRPGLDLTPITTLQEARRPAARTFRCGVDTLFDLDLARTATA